MLLEGSQEEKDALKDTYIICFLYLYPMCYECKIPALAPILITVGQNNLIPLTIIFVHIISENYCYIFLYTPPGYQPLLHMSEQW